jgi:hypothetical protein
MGADPEHPGRTPVSSLFVLEDDNRLELIDAGPGRRGLSLELLSKLLSGSSGRLVIKRLEPPCVEMRGD